MGSRDRADSQLNAVVPNYFRYTARHKITQGDIEARMKAHPPEGYSFVDCNWKKRKAKFVSVSSGSLQYVSF